MNSSKKGFTMVELLVVILIIGILASIATPMLLSQAERAKASEAVATLSHIRQEERNIRTKFGSYQALADGNNLAYEPTDATPGLGVDIGAVQYFSDACYTVVTVLPAWTDTTIAPAPVDFVIRVDGSDSELLATDTVHGAARVTATRNEVTNFRLEMDNSGRIYVTYNANAATPTWRLY